MSRQTFPNMMAQPGALLFSFRIDGSAVGASAGSAGLNGRGKFMCEISKAANVVTIDWTPAWGDLPDIIFQPAAGQTDTIVELVSESASQLVFQTVKATDNTAVNDADLIVYGVGYNTTSFVS